MKRLLSYMGAYKKESILGPLFKMLEASFELFVPLVVASMVDVGIANRSVSYVVRMGGLLLLLAAIGLTCSLTAQYFAAKAATGTATALRNNLFSHIGTLSYTCLLYTSCSVFLIALSCMMQCASTISEVLTSIIPFHMERKLPSQATGNRDRGSILSLIHI